MNFNLPTILFVSLLQRLFRLPLKHLLVCCTTSLCLWPYFFVCLCLPRVRIKIGYRNFFEIPSLLSYERGNPEWEISVILSTLFLYIPCCVYPVDFKRLKCPPPQQATHPYSPGRERDLKDSLVRISHFFSVPPKTVLLQQ